MDKLYLERLEISVDDDVLIGDVKGFRSTMLTPIMRPLSRAEKQDQSRYGDNNGDNNRSKDLSELLLLFKFLMDKCWTIARKFHGFFLGFHVFALSLLYFNAKTEQKNSKVVLWYNIIFKLSFYYNLFYNPKTNQ